MKYSTIESKITGSDDMFVHLEKGARINKSDILDIDHPGNVHALVLTPIAAVAWAVAIYFLSYVNEGLGAVSLLVAIPATIGSGWGLVTWLGSRSAVAFPSKPKITPVALSDGESTYWGLGMSWSW
jgi:hypothetical protein